MNNKNALNDKKLDGTAGGWFTNAEVRGYLGGYTNEDDTKKLGQVLKDLKNEAVGSRSRIKNLEKQNAGLQGELNSYKNSSNAAREAGNNFMGSLGL